MSNTVTLNTVFRFDIGYFLFGKGSMVNPEGKEYFPGFWNKIVAIFAPPGYYPGTVGYCRKSYRLLFLFIDLRREDSPLLLVDISGG